MPAKKTAKTKKQPTKPASKPAASKGAAAKKKPVAVSKAKPVASRSKPVVKLRQSGDEGRCKNRGQASSEAGSQSGCKTCQACCETGGSEVRTGQGHTSQGRSSQDTQQGCGETRRQTRHKTRSGQSTGETRNQICPPNQNTCQGACSQIRG